MSNAANVFIKFAYLSCNINSPSIIELKQRFSSVVAPLKMTSICILIRNIFPLLLINIKCLSPSALSVTQYEYGTVIFGITISGFTVDIFLICKVFELGPIKSFAYALSFGIYSCPRFLNSPW